MKERIALFTTVDESYIKNAIRCFQIFKENNPGVFDYFIITSANVESYQEELHKNNINVINVDLSDVFKIDDRFGYPSEMYWYNWAPLEFNKRGYKFSMCVDSDNVNMKPLNFDWLSDDFALAGSPRMRNNLSEEIDAWYYIQAISSKEKSDYLEKKFDLINKDNIIDIHSGVLIFNNERWVSENLYEKSLELFNKSKDDDHPMIDDDSLLGLLLLVTPKHLYKHISVGWNWYYEQPEYKTFGGEDVEILHMNWLKPWVKSFNTINDNLNKGYKIWNMENKRTVHVIGCPGNPSAQNITIDPFARVSYYLTTYLHRNDWNVEYYGYEESTVECSKKWGCVNIPWKEKYTTHNTDSPPEVTWEFVRDFCDKVRPYLRDRAKPGDIVLCTWSSHIQNLQEFKEIGVKLVDAHVGHYSPNPLTTYHVYASDSLRSWMYAKDEDAYMNCKWHDVVIPPMAHSLNDYTYTPQKGNYFLFMSRLIENKGLGIVFDIANQMRDHEFKIAGPGDWDYWKNQAPPNVEYIGYLDGDLRRQWVSSAKAVITPALYFEPFGLTAVESAVSGTPVITTDWGGYTNNVVHGVTGFRCTHLSEFIEAIENIDEIDPSDCRGWGEAHSAENLIYRWEDYLIRVARENWHDLKIKDYIRLSFRKQ